jgi:hypothetical protein
MTGKYKVVTAQVEASVFNSKEQFFELKLNGVI